MGNIWCVGQRYDALITNAAVTTSDDGIIWNDILHINPPFLSRDEPTSIIFNNNSLVVGSTIGNISITTNFLTWTEGSMGADNGIIITGMTASSSFFTCGQRTYLTSDDIFTEGSEVAQIFRSNTGYPGTFNLVFTEGDFPTIFYNIKYFPSADIGNSILQEVVVAVGNHTGSPYAVYSTDNGTMWSRLDIPNEITGSFFDIEYDSSNAYWYIGGSGKIVIASNLINPVWTESTTFGDTLSEVYRLHMNPQGQIVAATPGALWFSSNLENWNSFSVPGYFWKSITWYNNQWIAGAQSIMTQYTFWVSSDAVTWIPHNNHVQPVSFTIS